MLLIIYIMAHKKRLKIGWKIVVLWIKKSFMLFINRKSSSSSLSLSSFLGLMLYIHGSIIEKGLDKHFHSTAAAAALSRHRVSFILCRALLNLRIYNEGKMNSMKNPETLPFFLLLELLFC